MMGLTREDWREMREIAVSPHQLMVVPTAVVVGAMAATWWAGIIAGIVVWVLPLGARWLGRAEGQLMAWRQVAADREIAKSIDRGMR